MSRLALKPIRYLAIGATLALAACGGNAAPAASPSAAAPSASAAAKPSAAASIAAKPAASASAKPAVSGAAAGGAAVKPALPSSCPSPSAAAKPAAGASAAAKPAVSAAAKPSFTPQTDVIGEAAPGPYKPTAQVSETAGTPLKVVVPGLAFGPNTIVVKPGDNVTLNVTNCTTFGHNFYSPGLNVKNKVNIPAAGEATVTFKAPDKAGKYMFWCTTTPPGGLSHAARGMTGEVIVQ